MIRLKSFRSVRDYFANEENDTKGPLYKRWKFISVIIGLGISVTLAVVGWYLSGHFTEKERTVSPVHVDSDS